MKKKPIIKGKVDRVKLDADETALQWLAKWGYNDIAAIIRGIEARWKREGNGTRRSWWEVLAGGFDGKPSTIGGHCFPVLASAQRRQGKPVTANAQQRDPHELAPYVKATGRWHPSARKTRTKK